jgi:uncharacterized protein YneF (UPF0154 family)
MDTTEIALIVAAFVALGFSLYKKYMKKDQVKNPGHKESQTGSFFQSHSKDDDYEPYSGK